MSSGVALMVAAAMLVVMQPLYVEPAYAAGPPAIVEIAPNSGPAGTAVTITGTGFGAAQGTSKVTFGGYKAPILSWSDTSIQCSVPAGAVTGYVGVWVDGIASNGVYFIPAARPALDAVTPSAAPSGSSVTFTGTGFGAVQGTGQVTFAGLVAAVTSWSDTSITAVVPAGASAGYAGVWQNGLCSNGRMFVPASTPAITSLDAAVASIGTTVTVTGSNFGASPGTLTLGGVVVSTSTWSDTFVTFAVPADAVAGYVGVWKSGICSNGAYFMPAPHIAALSTWWAAEGTTVTITGTGFGATQGVNRVTLGTTTATPSAWSDTSITFTVPLGVSSGYVGVWRSDACSNGAWLLVSAAPTISDVDPIAAPVGGVFTISGSAFSETTGTITVSGIEAPVLSWHDTAIQAQVPIGATSGYVGVWKQGIASNGRYIDVLAAPESGGASLGMPSYAALLDGVNVASGNLVVSGFSASISGNGEGTQISSTYNSQDLSAGPAGSGWTFSFEERLVEYPNGCEAWLRPDGSLHVFGRMPDGSYASAQGTYASLVRSGDGTFTLVDRDKMTYVFSPVRLLTSKTDRNGNATVYAYDGTGRATSMTDASGRISTFAYDAQGRLITATDCAGRVTDFEYDASGRVVLMTLPEVTVGPEIVRYTIGYDYDAEGRLVGVTDARGNLTMYAYDGTSTKVASITPPVGSATTFAYSAVEGETTVSDGSGSATVFGWDAAGAIVRTSGAGTVSTSMSHDVQMNEVAASDATGASISCSYDVQGRPTASTDPTGATTTYTYSDASTAAEPLVVAEPSGATTSATYDNAGNRTSETDPMGSASEYAYDEHGNMTSVTDALGATSLMSYDSVGNMTGMQDPAGAVTTLAYNDLGLVVSGSDASGISGAMHYDELGRLLSVDSAGQTVESYSYDENGNQTAITDAKGNRVLSVFDAAGSVLSVTPDPVILSQEEAGSATDVNTGTVAYAYDTAGRLSTRTDQAGNAWTLSYDPATGQLLSETDEAGRTTSYVRDTLGQLTGASFADGSSASFTYNTRGLTTSSTLAGRGLSFSYDDHGNQTTASVSGGVSISRAFDLAGRLTSETLGTNTTSYSYDAAGRTTSISPSGLDVRGYTYDVASRPATVTVGGQWVAADHDAAGMLTQVRRSNGIKTTLSYDAAGMIAARSYVDAADVPKATWAYTYDAKGNVASVTDLAGVTQRYFYDNLDQLVNVRDASGTLQYNYTHDQAGNRITSFVAGQGTTSYTYGDLDTTRLTGMTTPSGAASFAYDDQGRVISRTDSSGLTTYTWAYDGYLASVALPSGRTVAYDYDASWRMISRAVSFASVTTTTTYQYDQNALVAERDGAGAVLASYVYGPDGRLESMTRGGSTYQYVLDEHGSVTAMLDGTGAVVNAYSYDPYGSVIAKTEGVENPFTYSGYKFDSDTGLFHLMARWYDPATGRFLSRDAVQDVQGDPLSANHYLYCKNDPVNKVDPEGTYAKAAHMALAVTGCIAISAVVVGVFGIAILKAPVLARWWLKKKLSSWFDVMHWVYWGNPWKAAGTLLWSETKSAIKGELKKWAWKLGKSWATSYFDLLVWNYSAGMGWERYH